MWNVTIHRLVIDEDFKSINEHDQSIILKTIRKKLGTAPEKYGSPLRHDLKGFRKLKISDYRVIYRIEKADIKVYVVKVGLRKDEKVYKEMMQRLKKI
ncbi:MAG: type II toxin-antitoxin system RelE/ParE family toxin [Deltaproteobacteria bacterium]|jgi:mRNA interferase RelE/StbE|nr:type II toxin-antitoxin system RelE/ParE family toxin [Deltaproteobacteria bacterium]MBT4089166.1 type II toxin-antitoxin system RelE/ParE family toxin [Deltaproteobacteria bacterium]MBT4267467.1 type II toxin-antitoxin system RelE/ParE family toxin [Deltaproteobacteria bacterium]MBT4640724.1 type II toxin-antitoxin system RelE/ParE family toxin [Deltaproteobacteria bacterium]MBT6503692.1 type II toxin-antitoxin system RelE/ParE family toxin [Deltaproteobacteria bacterium]